MRPLVTAALFLLGLLTTTLALNPSGTTSIKIGLSLSVDADLDDSILADSIQGVFIRAAQLNAENSSLIDPNARLEVVFLNGHQSSSRTISNALSLTNSGVVAVIGSGFSSLTILSSLIFQTSNLPQCDGSATSPALSQKGIYPNFFRPVPTDVAQTAGMVGYIISQGWKQVAVFYSNEDYGTGLNNAFVSLARASNITVLSQQPLNLKCSATDAMNAALQVQQTGARIMLWLGYAKEFDTLLVQVKTLGMFGSGYAWIGTDAMQALSSLFTSRLPDFAGFLYFSPKEREGPAAPGFDTYWKNNRLLVPNPNASMSTTAASGPYGYFAASCVDLLALGLDAVLKAKPSNNLSMLAAGTAARLLQDN
ncbi:hypothetical protein HDV03_005471 [Kappamyces sp. JEL0829]|nr:hypothetical protein HDV03_005471 [Kappamyces sp. JEL0829]KAJ3334938.1 hypothetical protein HDU91_002443 [Kappamyces sp. JEL0680]